MGVYGTICRVSGSDSEGVWVPFGGENWRKKGSNRLFDVALNSLFVDRGVVVLVVLMVV